MPNRADHTVNSPQPDQSAGINSYALISGLLLAVVAALTVILSGETLGQSLGISILTILIFFQIFWLLRVQARPQAQLSPVTGDGAGDHARSVFETEPILLVSISSQGRARALIGNPGLLPGLKVGSIIDDLLSGAMPPSGTIEHKDLGLLSVQRVLTPNGGLLLISPSSDAKAHSELLERTRFFAGMGHDLKSPLNGIIGFADIMKAELKCPLPEAYKDYPSVISEGGQTLLRLIEDMLGYAKAEAGTYELDPSVMDIAASGESVMRQSQAVADLAGIKLRFRERGEVLAFADAGAVRRIWDNLVSNAIKYSSHDDTVILSTYARGDDVYLEVMDTGAGMHAEDLARIARPFAQGENSKGRSGTGLGLAMVQKLADLQGGQVQIQTAPGQGTTVTVRLPAAKTQKRAAE